MRNLSWSHICLALLFAVAPVASFVEPQAPRINVRDFAATGDGKTIDTNRDGIDVDACRNVRLSNLTVTSPFDDGICPKSSFALGVARATENVTITNCQVSGYDEGTPAYAMFARHVSNLTVRDAEFTFDHPEYRPAFQLLDVTRADIADVRAQKGGSGLTFVLRSVRDLLVRNCPGVKDVQRAAVARESF